MSQELVDAMLKMVKDACEGEMGELHMSCAESNKDYEIIITVCKEPKGKFDSLVENDLYTQKYERGKDDILLS